MEALRLSQIEIEKLRRKRHGLEATVGAVERRLRDPVVTAAIHNLEPFAASPSVVPDEIPVDENSIA